MNLHSPTRKAALAGLVVAFCAAYVYVAGRDLLAWRWANSKSREKLERASALAGGNADYADRLGRQYFYASQDVPGAVREFERATSLNPGMAQYWMDLALAYSAAGQTSREREAVREAIQADPRTPYVAWDAANFYFALGDFPAAMAQLRPVFQYQSWSARDAMELSWRATHDAPLILEEALPDDAETRASFLKFLLEQNDPQAAAQVWSRMVESGQPFEARLAFPYVQFLLDQKRVAGAQQAWRDLARLDHGFAAYQPALGVMVNGGFEQEILNSGFDWRYQQVPHVNLALDPSEAHSGARSLLASFDGGPVREVGFWQSVPVRPGTKYELSAFSQAREWSGAGGLRLAVEDAFDHTPYGASELLATTAGWRQSTFTFTTGPQTTLVTVKLVPEPAGGTLSGRLWLDDVSLQPQP